MIGKEESGTKHCAKSNRRSQPFDLHDHRMARRILGGNFVVAEAFKPHTVHSGNLITG